MNSKERVKKAILFQKPDRVSVSLPKPWVNDFMGVSPGPDPDFKPKAEGEDEDIFLHKFLWI